ncbi:MAG: hypothetical protein II965_09215, partial [Pyramidobacter sp.]|nr:hypothetical protein [Pyramidobacter sp.]
FLKDFRIAVMLKFDHFAKNSSRRPKDCSPRHNARRRYSLYCLSIEQVEKKSIEIYKEMQKNVQAE